MSRKSALMLSAGMTLLLSTVFTGCSLLSGTTSTKTSPTSQASKDLTAAGAIVTDLQTALTDAQTSGVVKPAQAAVVSKALSDIKNGLQLASNALAAYQTTVNATTKATFQQKVSALDTLASNLVTQAGAAGIISQKNVGEIQALAAIVSGLIQAAAAAI